MHTLTDHQKKQIQIINQIEQQVKSKSLSFSIVEPTKDYKNDPRLTLTSVHFPNQSLTNKVTSEIINPLRQISPYHYYYPESSLHMTIKNVRVINFPTHFTDRDIEKVKEVMSKTIPAHNNFKVYFYRLLFLPNNLSLVGTTDEELDNLILELDQKLKEAGVPDDKKYINNQFFFSNMTLARFLEPLSDDFIAKVDEISNNLEFEQYMVNSVTLLTCNASLTKKNIIAIWQLK